MARFARVAAAGIGMSNRRHDIDAQIQHLRKLESQFVDQKTLDGIKALIDRLEDEKATLHDDKQ